MEYSITILIVGCLITGYSIKMWNSDQVVFPIRTKGHKIYKTQREKFMKVKNFTSIMTGLLFIMAGGVSFIGNVESIMISILAFGVAIALISEKVLKKCIDFGTYSTRKGAKKKK